MGDFGVRHRSDVIHRGRVSGLLPRSRRDGTGPWAITARTPGEFRVQPALIRSAKLSLWAELPPASVTWPIGSLPATPPSEPTWDGPVRKADETPRTTE